MRENKRIRYEPLRTRPSTHRRWTEVPVLTATRRDGSYMSLAALPLQLTQLMRSTVRLTKRLIGASFQHRCYAGCMRTFSVTAIFASVCSNSRESFRSCLKLEMKLTGSGTGGYRGGGERLVGPSSLNICLVAATYHLLPA